MTKTNERPKPSALHSREKLAGYDRTKLESGVVLLVGAGAAGNNLALHLALVGVGELRIVDPDVIERSNLTRSPLFRSSGTSTKPRAKARDLASAFVSTSYAEEPVSRYAARKIQAVGRGAFQDVDVVVSAVDRFDARRYLADSTRLLGIPLVEVGFRYPAGHVSVFPNRTAEESCFCCLYPDLPPGGVSCGLYARTAIASGRTPNTQTIAALATSYVAEAVIQALHGAFPLGNAQLAFDVTTGESRTTRISRDRECPGVHRRYDRVEDSSATIKQPLSALLEAAREDAMLRLPQPFILSAPCAHCGAAVDVKVIEHELVEAPTCQRCPDVPQLGGRRLEVLVETTGASPDARRLAKNVGLRPLDIVEIWTGDECRPLRLAGDLSELFSTKTPRRPGNKAAPESMGESETQGE